MRALALAISLWGLPGILFAQDVTAVLEPAEIVEVRPNVSGRIIDLAVQEGDEVAADALLLRIDAREQAQRVALAQAVAEADGRLQRAAAQIAQAQALLERLQAARIRGAVQDWEVEQAAQAVALAQADQQIARDGQMQSRAQLALEQAIFESYTLRAPFAGVVLDVRENTGANVDTQTVVLTLAQLASLEATAFVPLEWADELTVGQSMPAVAQGVGALDATVVISAIDPRIDPASRTVRLRLTLDNGAGHYQPGATLVLQPPAMSE